MCDIINKKYQYIMKEVIIMEKTKLGLSAGILGAVAYLMFLFGGYVPGLLLVGYILLRESDCNLKTSAITALFATLLFSVANVVVGLLPDVINIFESLLSIFGAYIGIDFVSRIANFLYNVLSLLKTVVFVFLAGMSLLNKPVQLPIVKKLVD